MEEIAVIRCVRCGRRLLRAAATIPAVETGPTPHPAGALGKTCAVKAGLLPPSLFSRRRVSRRRPRRPSTQLEISA
jgi:hypothetical protein